MKKSIAFGNKNIECFAIQLCSYGESGDFEFMPSESLQLKFDEITQQMKEKVPNFRNATERFLMFQLREAQVTLYPSGRMILENVKPAQKQIAMEIGEKILKLADLKSN
ncbi:hypothetical protein GF337_00125 [candidate division KSB1 bacterium]|nr:hypothetical protein [candidate division KSB1 bacterium]